MLGLLVTAREVIVVVYGERWLPVVPVLQVLCIVGLVQSVVTTVGWIYMARARTDLLFLWGVGATAIIVASFFVGVRGGIQGVAIAYGVANLILLVPALLIPFRLVGLRLRDLWRSIRGVLAGSVVMAAVTAGARAALLAAGLGPLWVLVVTVAIGVAVYVGWLVLADSAAMLEARSVWSGWTGDSGASRQ